jgi:hypothetical protein
MADGKTNGTHGPAKSVAVVTLASLYAILKLSSGV